MRTFGADRARDDTQTLAPIDQGPKLGGPGKMAGDRLRIERAHAQPPLLEFTLPVQGYLGRAHLKSPSRGRSAARASVESGMALWHEERTMLQVMG